MMTKMQHVVETDDMAKRELYHLISEGYEAMQEGRVSTIEEVKKKLEKRREQFG